MKKQGVELSDPLSGLKIVWIGSSVTYGFASGGYSMADAIEERHPSTKCYKYAVCGTTMANYDKTSYVQRIQDIDRDIDADILIIQLSTNDATQMKPMGVVSESKDIRTFDDKTVTGAMEYMIAYAKATWNVPIIFYTGTYYKSEEVEQSEQYGKMVNMLLELQKKWGIGVIDLWNDQEMKALYGTEQYQVYMSDGIHPSREGYISWWTPKFEKMIRLWISQK